MPPVPAGTAPRLLELKPDANGRITITVLRTEMQKIQPPVAVGGPAALPPMGAREIAMIRPHVVELSEVKDLAITTADGKKVDKDEAMKKLQAGGIVVVSGDGKPVSTVFLKVFKEETLVLVSPELIATPGSMVPPMPGYMRATPAPIPAQVLPGAPVPAVVPAAPLPAAQPVPVNPPPAAKGE
jgi:hypothetical protein